MTSVIHTSYPPQQAVIERNLYAPRGEEQTRIRPNREDRDPLVPVKLYLSAIIIDPRTVSNEDWLAIPRLRITEGNYQNDQHRIPRIEYVFLNQAIGVECHLANPDYS